MNSVRQTLSIVVLGAALCLAWAGVVHFLPRPELAETNYVANRLRIEHWLLDPPTSNVLVGTSISGRLLSAYFANTPLHSLSNLGLDGANPDTGLALVLSRPIPPAAVFLEVHRLIMPPSANDAKLRELVRGPDLELSRYAPITRADWRPSTVLYAWLKSRQTGGGTVGVSTAPVEPEAQSAKPDADWAPRIREKVKQIQARGTKVWLIRLPVGRENPPDASSLSFADQAAVTLNLPLIDLYRLGQRTGEAVKYTDGLHLTPRSAAQAARQLAEMAGGQ